MPVELQIIRAADFVRMGAEGQFDLAASCAVLAHLAMACKKRGIDRALLDVRNVRAELTPTELAALVNIFHEMGFNKSQRLAILHSADRSQRPRLFALIGRMKGWMVHAFLDFEEALGWLSEERQEPVAKAATSTLDGSASAKTVTVHHGNGHAGAVSIKPQPRRKTGHTEFLIRTAKSVTHAN